MPFHHRVNEGLIQCSDCHNVHGTVKPNQVRAAATQDEVCFKCHTDKQGPFVFEHAPVKVDGCESCHPVHGGPNPHMLKLSNVNLLCLQCHTTSSFSSAPGAPSFHNQASFFQSCVLCHVAIHGSNLIRRFSNSGLQNLRFCGYGEDHNRNQTTPQRECGTRRQSHESRLGVHSITCRHALSRPSSACRAASAQDDSEASPGINSADYNIQQTIEFGYRANEINGNKDTYDTFVNLGSGVRLFDYTLGNALDRSQRTIFRHI